MWEIFLKFLTRQVCSFIIKNLSDVDSRPIRINKYKYDNRREELEYGINSVIHQILNVLEIQYPSEFELLKHFALEGASSFKKYVGRNDNTISHLIGYCLIKKEGITYELNIDFAKKTMDRIEKLINSRRDRECGENR